MMHPNLPAHLRHLITISTDERLPGELLVFADFVDERMEDEWRAGAIRKVASKGPVEVEPARPELIRRMDAVSDSPLPFVGYFPVNDGDCSPFCSFCNYAVALGLPGVSGTWRHGHCTKCWRRCWALAVTQESAAREFLDRLRIQCLTLFRPEIRDHIGFEYQTIAGILEPRDTPGIPCGPLRVDPRWPPLRCALCDATMCRCHHCAAEWCLDHTATKTPLACPECGSRPNIITADWSNRPTNIAEDLRVVRERAMRQIGAEDIDWVIPPASPE